MQRKEIKKMLECQLTDADKIEYGQRSADLTLEIVELESEKKKVADTFKAKIEIRAVEVKKIAQTTKDGYDLREVACEEIRDFDDRSVTIIRMDTGEQVSQRAMSIDEMQEQFRYAHEAEYEEAAVETDDEQPAPEEGKIVRIAHGG